MLGILKNRDSQIGLKFCCILLIRHMPVEFHMRLKYQLKCFVFHIPCFNYKICHELLPRRARTLLRRGRAADCPSLRAHTASRSHTHSRPRADHAPRPGAPR